MLPKERVAHEISPGFYQANLMLERLEIPVAAFEALDLVFDVHGSPRQIDPSAEVRQRVEGLLNRAGTIEADDEGYLKLNSKKYRLITALNESEKVWSGRR